MKSLDEMSVEELRKQSDDLEAVAVCFIGLFYGGMAIIMVVGVALIFYEFFIS